MTYQQPKIHFHAFRIGFIINLRLFRELVVIKRSSSKYHEHHIAFKILLTRSKSPRFCITANFIIKQESVLGSKPSYQVEMREQTIVNLTNPLKPFYQRTTRTFIFYIESTTNFPYETEKFYFLKIKHHLRFISDDSRA